MSPQRRLTLAAFMLAAFSGCGGIPFPEDLVQTARVGSVNARVAGTAANDLWFPSCQASLTLNHWTGNGWTPLKVDGVGCSNGGFAFYSNAAAIAGPGQVWIAAGERLLLLDATGKVEDHSDDAALGGKVSFAGVYSFRGVAVVLARHAPDSMRYDKTVMLRFQDGKFVSLAEAPTTVFEGGGPKLAVIGANDIWASVFSEVGEPDWMNGYAKPYSLRHFDGQGWRQFDGDVDVSTVDPSFASTDLWSATLQHFDGISWQQLPSKGAVGVRAMRASNGGLVLSASVLSHADGDDYLAKGRTVQSGVYRWLGSEWSPFEPFATNVTNSCASIYTCGNTVTGYLEDGTIISTEVGGDGSDPMLVSFKP